MNEFLGIVTDPGERLFGTVSRLGKDLSVQKGYLEIGNFLVKSGIGIVIGEGQAIPVGYVPLRINNKLQNKYGQRRNPRGFKETRVRRYYKRNQI